jgi:hypothetical protein
MSQVEANATVLNALSGSLNHEIYSIYAEALQGEMALDMVDYFDIQS